MRTFVTDGQTDRRTDGADYIGPEAGPETTDPSQTLYLLAS